MISHAARDEIYSACNLTCAAALAACPAGRGGEACGAAMRAMDAVRPPRNSSAAKQTVLAVAFVCRKTNPVSCCICA